MSVLNAPDAASPTEVRTAARSLRDAAPFAGIAAAGAIAFAWLCDAVGDHDGITAVDLPVARWFAEHRTAFEGQVGLLVARATGPAVLVVLTLLVSGFLWWRSRRQDAVLLSAGVALAYTVGGITKFAEHRARPAAPINLAPETEPSFPSGHVLVVTTLVGLLLLITGHQVHGRARAISGIAAVLVIGVVAVDRLVVGAHWATDVLGSIPLALVIVAGAGAVLGWRTPALEDARRDQIT